MIIKKVQNISKFVIIALLQIVVIPISFAAYISNLELDNIEFTGRESELEGINKLLKDNNIVSLSGFPGIGKTQIAKKYAHSSLKKYKIIWWINSDRNIELQFKKLAEQLNEKTLKEKKINTTTNDDKAIMNTTKDILKNLPEEWLIVYDNYNNYHSIKGDLPYSHKGDIGKVLITTRHNNLWNNNMKIETFKRNESIAMIEKIIKNISQKDATNLSILLGDYPLAIVQSSKYIKYTGVSVPTYIKLFNVQKKELEENEKILIQKGIISDYKITISVVMKVAIEEILKELPREMKEFLFVIANIYNKNIPRDLIVEYFNNNELKSSALVATALDYSFLNKEIKYENSNIDTYNIHELQQVAINNYIGENYIKENILKITSSFNKLLTRKIEKTNMMIFERPYMLKHIEILQNKMEEFGIKNNEMLELEIRTLEYYLSGKRDRIKAEQIIKKIDVIIDRPWVEKMLIARYKMMLASLQIWFTADYEKALKYTEDALVILKKYPLADEEKMMCYNRMGQILILKGLPNEAIEYSDLTKKLLEKNNYKLGNKDAYYGLRAVALMDTGDYQEAYKVNKYAIEDSKKINNNNKDIIGLKGVYIYKAAILIRQEKYREAIEELENIHLIISKDDYKVMYMAQIESLLAMGYLGIKEKELSKTYIHKSIDSFRKNDQKKNLNRNYAYALLVLGLIQAEYGDEEEAYNTYLKAEEIYRKIFKNMKVDEISELYINMAINAYRLKDQRHLDYAIKKHDEIFGLYNIKKSKIVQAMSENK